MNTSAVSTNARQKGFTLIELSIVLVIIGLIVGGVLVGQDLIKAAQIRATITQVEKYNTEVNTFVGKYTGVPGDLAGNTSSSFGMAGVYLLSANGAQGQGDGSGIVEDGACAAAGTGGANGNLFCGEISTFWAQLSWANLIDGGFGAFSTTGNGVPATAATVTTLGSYIPSAKLGTGMSFTVFSGSGNNYYGMLPITAISTGGVYTVNASGISPTTAAAIDTKLDDGLPDSGVVRAVAIGQAPITPSTVDTLWTPYGMTAPSVAASATAKTCTIGAGIVTDTYNQNATAGGTDPSCAMTFRFN